MRRNFSFSMPPASALSEPKVMVRAGLGVLFLANLIAAAYAFHVFDSSPQALQESLNSTLAERQTEMGRLARSRVLTGNVTRGKSESETFLATYMSSRRHTYSLLTGELNSTAKEAGMKMGDNAFAPLEAIEGSDDLDMLTLTINLEGGYNELKKFVNLLDRSPRFLIIESITVSPRPKGDTLAVSVKLNAFIREDKENTL